MLHPSEQCGHGFPSKASCVLCMEEGPIPQKPQPKQHAARMTVAQYEGECANDRKHKIDVGDLIGFVEDVGWCCEACIE